MLQAATLFPEDSTKDPEDSGNVELVTQMMVREINNSFTKCFTSIRSVSLAIRQPVPW